PRVCITPRFYYCRLSRPSWNLFERHQSSRLCRSRSQRVVQARFEEYDLERYKLPGQEACTSLPVIHHAAEVRTPPQCREVFVISGEPRASRSVVRWDQASKRQGWQFGLHAQEQSGKEGISASRID